MQVIGQICGNARKTIEEQCSGKRIIHRLPFEEAIAFLWPRASSQMRSKLARALYAPIFYDGFYDANFTFYIRAGDRQLRRRVVQK